MDKFATKVQFKTGTEISVVRQAKSNTQEHTEAAKLSWPQKIKSLLTRRRNREMQILNQMITSGSNNETDLYAVNALVGKQPEEREMYVFSASEAEIWCSPDGLPEQILSQVDSKQEFTLTEKLFIKPDYRNLPVHEEATILTTEDFFSILVGQGAKVIVRKGGAIGNIYIKVSDGTLFVPCSPDINVPMVRKNS
jgi:hypothetical protein